MLEDTSRDVTADLARDVVGWRLLMPVKGGPTAKSRLGDVVRHLPGLPEAIALDSVEAALACPRVVSVHVICADVGRGERLAALGARVVRESAPGSGLLAALDEGLAALRTEDDKDHDDDDDGGSGQRDGAPVAVLLADVPSLLPADLATALDEARGVLDAGGTAVVPDADGTGTVLLAGRLRGPETSLLRPRFGPGSALAHRRDGAVPVGMGLARLRRDVDTPAELEQARELGLGPRTAQILDAQTRDAQDRGGAQTRAGSSSRTACAPSAASFSAKCS
ncbi:2-phospho-L-lactate guanylyltransferase [Quadrisphaera granulorum]|uniref:2-phospho-L-lactate guanylyltransferase n=1 Tax=Quadrisphaera granulorum TaxID=317664 RepID=A0A316AEZ7_9ACTN|nr:NTP transferase domain-containing protein [Quadrisphaera granulorum]PWJ56355.1 2-phospho-L-lactate guanylyltransferase [Quadrisphaera granulorum]SZE94989.1 2-phospho-L-lactate guanylyltransferase [Quadrisphaera granulorum]